MAYRDYSTLRCDEVLAEAAWRQRFSRSAERERQLGVTREWLARHKEGVEDQRAASSDSD